MDAMDPQPMTPERLVGFLADAAGRLDVGHARRIGIDEPRWSGLGIGARLVGELRNRGYDAHRVDVADFLRPASVRFERGRDDPDAFYEDWVDLAALRREVLDPLGPDGSGRWLPSLWDAASDRATRAGYREAGASTSVVLDGWFLLGSALPFDLTVHVELSPGARARRVPPEDADRELPAWQRYLEEATPAALADVVVRADDPQRPAVLDRLRSRPWPQT